MTADDVDNYTIEDVVYPLPCGQTKYPKNELGQLYQDILGLSIHSAYISKCLLFSLAEDGIALQPTTKNLRGAYVSLVITCSMADWNRIGK